MQALVLRWGKCLNANGDYMEVRSVLSATNIPRINRGRIQFSAWQCSLLYFFDLEINPLKTSSASISMKVSWLSCLFFWWVCHADDKWLWITGWIILTRETEALGEKICRSTTMPTTKPATNVGKMELSNRLVPLHRPFLQIPGKYLKWGQMDSFHILLNSLKT
jgi:hypothetical protein